LNNLKYYLKDQSTPGWFKPSRGSYVKNNVSVLSIRGKIDVRLALIYGIVGHWFDLLYQETAASTVRGVKVLCI
jgi:hypothetical protein